MKYDVDMIHKWMTSLKTDNITISQQLIKQSPEIRLWCEQTFPGAGVKNWTKSKNHQMLQAYSRSNLMTIQNHLI